MAFRFKPVRCPHRQTRTVRTPDGDCEEKCRACGVTIVSSQEMEELLDKVLRGEAGRLNVSDRGSLNADQAAPDVEGQNLLFGGMVATQLRIFSILLLLMLTPAIAAAAKPASWPDSWDAYLYGAGGYDTILLEPSWSDAGGGYPWQIEAGVNFHGDPIAGGLMHAHVLSGAHDYDLGDWRQQDQAFCLNRAGADGHLDMFAVAGDSSGGYMPTCLNGNQVPEPIAAAAFPVFMLLLTRRRCV